MKTTTSVLTSITLLISATAVAADTGPGLDNGRYNTPADVVDFPDSPEQQRQLDQLWDAVIDGFVKQGIVGNPWNARDDAPRQSYLDPKNLPANLPMVEQPITWVAFPNRVTWYFNQSQGNPYQIPKLLLYPLVDDGRLNPDDPALQSWVAEHHLQDDLSRLLKQFPQIASNDLSNFAPLPVPSDICPNVNWRQPPDQWRDGKTPNNFGPNGPRGWKDEYNEWVVTRNAERKITKISFTAENPEYWFSLWRVDPQRVLALYHQLVSPLVTIDDLYLRDKQGQVVLDYRGQPFYNPLNKWNYGNRATASSGGAAHLTSPPNTVGAEIYLGAAATIIRALDSQNYSPQQMNCASQYGQSFRNSDPNIGMQANQIVRNMKLPLSLTNPIALYMQTPDFSSYQTPDGTPAASFFKIVRGRTAAQAGTNYDQILHAVFEVPDHLGYTVSDIRIHGKKIAWGAQMAETFNQALSGTAYASLQAVSGRPPVTSAHPPNPTPLALVSNTVLQAVVNNKSIDSATIPLLAPSVAPGEVIRNMALEAQQGIDKVSIVYTHPDGTVASGIKVTQKRTYPLSGRIVPGQHQAFDTYVYVIDVAVASDVTPGLYGLQLTNKGSQAQIAQPGALIVVPHAQGDEQ